MGGGLMQLVAYGAQDIYLTGNPQITFFKVVYRRHTNFSMESIMQTFSGNIGYGNRVSATISRNGDLVHKMYVEHTTTPDADTLCANYGSALLKEVEIEIGGQRIDKHYGHWMEVWAELTEPNPTGQHCPAVAAGRHAVAGTQFQMMSSMGGQGRGDYSGPERMFIPLQFWFCRNPGLALPLIALQYHEVKVNITIEAVANLANGGNDTTAMGDFQLWADYIYLDTDERRRFAQVSHEYLIEQVQHQSAAASTDVTLNFNHPVKELIWATHPIATCATNADGPSTPDSSLIGATAKIQLNGHDRITARAMEYFTRTQVHQHHSGYGHVPVRAVTTDGIAVYSFALKPEEHQPSGTCNFSRIDNAKLIMSTDIGGINIYAVNYNVLRIMSGMGGLAYSN